MYQRYRTGLDIVRYKVWKWCVFERRFYIYVYSCIVWVVFAIDVITKNINVAIINEVGFGYEKNVNIFFLKREEKFLEAFY